MAKYLDDTGTDYLIEKIKTMLGNKVDKTSNTNKIYGTTGGGKQTLLSYGDVGYAIPQRDVNGQITVPTTPTGVLHATSKSYVDNLTTPTQWRNATLNSTYISSGNCRYCVVGKIVIVQMWDIRFTQTAVNNFSGGDNLVAISGLPTGYAGLVNVCTGSQNIITLNVNNGNITNWYSAPTSASNYYNANFTYIKED